MGILCARCGVSAETKARAVYEACGAAMKRVVVDLPERWRFTGAAPEDVICPLCVGDDAERAERVEHEHAPATVTP